MANVLLLGGTGHLGTLVAAALLAGTGDVVIVAARAGASRETIVARLKDEFSATGRDDDRLFERLVVAPLPAPRDDKAFRRLFAAHEIDEVLNCAGCVDYFDLDRLRAASVDLVEDLLGAARAARIRRFIHVSTAFCSGYVDGEIPEALHEEPACDPSAYTQVKRRAERLIAESGVPYLLLRPGVVIGDSRDGRYSGKPYGLYQFWWSYERFLTDRYRETLHVVAPGRPLPLLHQDAFAAAVLVAREAAAAGAILHLVSAPQSLPTVEQLFRLWCENVARPRRLFLHRDLAEAPLREMDLRFRTWLDFVAANSAIATRQWRFERTGLERLIAAGLAFPDATLRSVERCQNRFVSASEPLRRYRERFSHLFPEAAGASPG